MVTVVRRFQRSVRIDADLDLPGAIEGFVCHRSTKIVIERMARLAVESRQRAFTWTGPYGSGKSSLALLLCAVIGSHNKLGNLARTHLDGVRFLDDAFPYDKREWLVVPVVGRLSDPIQDVRQAVARSIAKEPGKARTRRRKEVGSGNDVIERLKTEAEKRPKGGVFLVLDEMGKFLEGARGEETDIHFFQELAEAATRCHGRFFVLGIMHQAFGQYAMRLGREVQDEWAKVQGRFVDIPIVVTADEVIDLVGRAITCQLEHFDSRGVAEKVARSISRQRPQTPSDLADRLDACWPLHPVTAALLSTVSRRRFGQHERSVFGFLGSYEPQGFQDFLQESSTTSGDIYDPARFWDYLLSNLEPAILASPDGHRWAQGAEAVERCGTKGSLLHVRLAKTIAVIDLFRSGSGVMAEESILHASLSDVSEERLGHALKDLSEWSIAIFRRYLEAWAIYSGSDFDIIEAVKNERVTVPEIHLHRMNSLACTDPLFAKRHYHRTGTLRWFETELVSLSDIRKSVVEFKPSHGSSGKFILVIREGNVSDHNARETCRTYSKYAGEFPVAVGLPSNMRLICELGTELLALESVHQNRPELEGDSIARREVSSRIMATSDRLEVELRAAFVEATWFVDGQAYRDFDECSLSRLVSHLADQTFSKAPLIHSELVNRERPSSNSRAAIRKLLHAMVNHPGRKYLGIKGFKPERGLYSTVLEATGLHGPKEDAFGFAVPCSDGVATTVLPMWDKATEMLEGVGGMLPLPTLYEAWISPPFGIRRGLLPILTTAFLLANWPSVAVYVEGMFQPEMNDLVTDRILQNESKIKLRKVRLDGPNEHILRDLAKSISTISQETPELEPLAIARFLVKFAIGLPNWTKNTLSVSNRAQVVRRILLHASDPHQMLFVDLPTVLHSPAPNQFRQRIGDVLRELRDAYSLMLHSLQERMVKALGHRESDWSTLQERGRTVCGLTGDFRLDAFAKRLSRFGGDPDTMEAIAGMAVNKPPRDWFDRECDKAVLALADLALRFRHAEALAVVKGREPTQRAVAIVFGTGEDGLTVTESFEVGKAEEARVSELTDWILSGMESLDVDPHLLLAAVAEVGALIIESDMPDPFH